jgi:hypothetical protein
MLEIQASAKFYSGERILRIVAPGFYEPTDLVEVCYDEDETNFPIGAAQAHFIVYGYYYGVEEPDILPETPDETPDKTPNENEGELING